MSKESPKDKIFVAIKSAKLRVDCEKIAKEVNVGWGTSLRYALELLAQGQVNGMKTSKSWVFWVGDLPKVEKQSCK